MRIVVVCLALGLLALPAGAGAATRVPPKFFGTNWDAQIQKDAPPALQDQEWKRMHDSGVKSTRAPISWVFIETSPGVYDWTATDRLVELATRNDIELLPAVLYAPQWERTQPENFASPPKDPKAYAAFMTQLIARYGPKGAFWTAHPELHKRPLRYWQVWNEPHLPFQWTEPKGGDWAKDYGKLLRVASKAIHKADPHAKVVMAGLANASYKFVKQLYTRGKVHGSFDVASIHPYTATPDGVVELVRRFRLQMKHFGDARKPLWVGELSLPASKGKIKSKSNLQTTDKGLAKYITESFDALAKARGSSTTRVDRVYQYTWASVYCCNDQFSYTGLFEYDDKSTVTAKPAYTAYVRAARKYGALPRKTGRAAAGPGARSVPFGFFGTMGDGPLLDSRGVDLGSEANAMVDTGIESLRFTASWADAQPYPRWSKVPADEKYAFTDVAGVPTNFSYMDRIVTAAAARNMAMLPVVVGTPKWARIQKRDTASPPRGTQTYSDFVGGLVARYGPNGSFWTAHPELRAQPIRRWQIWNEPNTTFFWSIQPGARAYVKLLSAARRSIKRVDPGAQIVLAGLPNKSWTALKDLYRARAGGKFDVVALHPFTRRVSGVLTILRRARVVMRRNGDDAKPLLVTELSWPSGEGKLRTSYGFDVTPNQQAERVQTALPMLVRERDALKIDGVYWYTWLTFDKDKGYPFDWAGLSRVSRKGRVVRKPAFDAMKQTTLPFEGCTAKAAGDALSCASSP